MAVKAKYKISEPIRIGKLVLKNRIVFPPMNTNYYTENGFLCPMAEEYYIRRARGSAGLIVLEAASVTPDYKNHPAQPMLCDSRSIRLYADLAEKLHRYGTAVSVELVHYGGEAELAPHCSPSGISRHKDCHELTIEEIHDVEKMFIDAAENAYLADLDAVTLHATHGYLLAEFISPIFNKREDEYGGSLENRLRIVKNIIEGIHKRIGQNFPVIPRITANEFIEGGSDAEYAVEVAKLLESYGAAAIDISASTPSAYLFTTPPYNLPEGKVEVIRTAELIKKNVSIPVFAAIGIRTPQEAEEIITSGKADLISLGRALIADPDFLKKANEGKEELIHECISCMNCLNTLNKGQPMKCTVNPEAGRETEFDGIVKSTIVKNVLVIGGGPSGMEAAVVCAKRGHNVTLAEKQDKLGGSLLAAEIPAHKEALSRLIERYKKELDTLNVKVITNAENIESIIDKTAPDTIVVATGASYIRRIKGSDNKNVVTAIEALKDPAIVGEKVVIIGGGATGCETAEFLRGKRVEIECKGADGIGGELVYEERPLKYTGAEHDVTIVEMLNAIASDMDEFSGPLMLKSLEANGIKMNPGLMVEEITEKGVAARSIETGEKQFFDADTVILAGGLIPAPYEVGKDIETIVVGDSMKPGKITNAVYTAYIKAREI